MIFGREPAVITAVIKAAITFVSLTVIPLTATQQASLNALAAVLLGAIVAWSVARERVLPLLVGVVEAGVYVGVQFGWDVGADVQAALLVLVGAVVALVTRDRVVAAVDENGDRRSRHDLAA